jgi:hypothetical protein
MEDLEQEALEELSKAGDGLADQIRARIAGKDAMSPSGPVTAWSCGLDPSNPARQYVSLHGVSQALDATLSALLTEYPANPFDFILEDLARQNFGQLSPVMQRRFTATPQSNEQGYGLAVLGSIPVERLGCIPALMQAACSPTSVSSVGADAESIPGSIARADNIYAKRGNIL